jgi:hypothetical protein
MLSHFLEYPAYLKKITADQILRHTACSHSNIGGIPVFRYMTIYLLS